MDSTAPTSDNRHFDFHLKEFERLRDEIMYFSSEMRGMERAAVIGPVIAYSWLAVQGKQVADNAIVVIAWWLPLLLVFALARRRHFAFINILRIAGYIRRLEETLALPGLGGWEHHINDLDTRRRRSSIFVGDRLLWTLLCAVYFIIPCVATQQRLFELARDLKL